ncbi:Multidrug resistance protein B [[Clostridium] ultunense Esp]|nr:Multidrug resistance protein B [[Clostridium] ultunense Esp]
MAFANSAWFTSPWVTYAALLIQSVSVGFMMPASDAMLVDVSTKENRRWMYSINYWSLNLSTAVGSLTGGLFFVTNHFHLFLAMVLVSILNLLLLLLFIHDTYQPAPSPKKDPNPFKKMAMNYVVVARDRTFALYWLAGLLVLSLSFQIPNYITIRLQEEFTPLSLHFFGHPLTLDGVFVGGGIRTLNTILIVAGAFAAAWMVKRMSNRIALFVGVFLNVLGHALLGFVNDLALLAFSVVLLSLGELIYVPVKQSILAEIAPDNLRSSYMALNGMVFQGARLSGALGITVGAFLPPGVMSTLFLLAGFSGLFLFQRVLDRLTPAPSAHAEKGRG